MEGKGQARVLPNTAVDRSPLSAALWGFVSKVTGRFGAACALPSQTTYWWGPCLLLLMQLRLPGARFARRGMGKQRWWGKPPPGDVWAQIRELWFSCLLRSLNAGRRAWSCQGAKVKGSRSPSFMTSLHWRFASFKGCRHASTVRVRGTRRLQWYRGTLSCGGTKALCKFTLLDPSPSVGSALWYWLCVGRGVNGWVELE